MLMRRVKAIDDFYGRDITGNVVDMLQGTTHLVSETDVEFYLARPLKFEVSGIISIATYEKNSSGNDVGLVLTDGSVLLFSSLGSGGTTPDLIALTNRMNAVETVNATQSTDLNNLLAALLTGITVIDNKITYPVSGVTPATVSTVSNASATEGASVVHTVTLNKATPTSQTFSFAVNNGTASSGDYTLPPTFNNGVTLSGATLTVPGGVSSFTVTIATVQETTVEANETYTLVVGGVSGTGTIINDDSASSASVSSVAGNTITEGGTIVFTVGLSAASIGQTFAYTVTGTANSADLGTATFSNSVTASGGNLTVPSGVTGFTISIPTVDDADFEPNETVIYTIGGVSGTATITNNDSAVTPTISSVVGTTVTEGGTLQFTVTLSAASTGQVFTFSTSGTASGADLNTATYSNSVTVSGVNMTVPNGVTSFIISVPVIDDTLAESSETLIYTIGGVSGTGTITDNDSVQTYLVGGVENVPNLPATVNFTDATTLDYHVYAGGGSTDIASGERKTGGGNLIAVAVYDPDVNPYAVDVSEPKDVTITGTDSAPTGTFSKAGVARIINFSTNLKQGGAKIDVAIPSGASEVLVYGCTYYTEATSSPFTFSASLANGSAAAIAITPTTLTQNGVSQIVFKVSCRPSAATTLTIICKFNARAANTLRTYEYLATLLKTATPLVITLASVSAVGSASNSEGGTITHLVSLDKSTPQTQTFAYAFSHITTVAGDISSVVFTGGVTLSGNTLTVPGGVQNFNIVVQTAQDATVEPSEAYTVSVDGIAGTGTILNDDASPTNIISTPVTSKSGVFTTVTFTTQDALRGGVDFGSTTAYGTAVVEDYGTAVTSHTIVLEANADPLLSPHGLTVGQTCNLRAAAGAGAAIISANITFVA